MKATCPSCSTHYNVDDARIPAGGAKLRCAKCETTFPVKKEAAPSAANASMGVVPLPGAGASSRPPASQAVGGLHPFSSPGEAVPLPGGMPPPESWTEQSIPLPGQRASASPPPSRSHNFGQDEAVPLPGQAAHGGSASQNFSDAIPLPGGTVDDGSNFGADFGADFADGAAAPQHEAADDGSNFGLDFADGSDAIPLPGSAPAASTDDYGASFDEGVTSTAHDVAEAGFSDVGFEEAVPLPGQTAQGNASDFGVGFDAGDYADADAVPLPGQTAQGAASGFSDEFGGGDFGGADFDPLTGETAPSHRAAPSAAIVPEAPRGSAIPLPGAEVPGFESVDSDPWADAVPAAAASSVADGGGEGDWGDGEVSDVAEADFAELPPAPVHAASPNASTSLSIDEADDFLPDSPHSTATGSSASAMDEWSAEPAPEPAWGAPAAADVMEDDLPAVASSPVLTTPPHLVPEADFSFSGKPDAAPADDPFGSFDAAPPAVAMGDDDLPAPADDLLPASHEADPFGADAGAVAAPEIGFGEVSFDDGAAAGAEAEDPFAPSMPVGSNENLETLSFDDEAPLTSGFHVRRKSGKVFGPFDDATIIKMLEEGQLLGNEDISRDNANFSSISSHAPFAQTLDRMSQPVEELAELPEDDEAAESAEPFGAAGATAEGGAGSLDRFKNLYGGRMAAPAVVDNKAADDRFRKRLPLFIGAAAAVLLIAAGASLGFTKYGAFGVRKLLPATVKNGTAEGQLLASAKKAILDDTLASYKEAKALSEKALRAREYPEIRAVWSQAVFSLARRYEEAKGEVPTASASMESLDVFDEKNAEVVKAHAGDALVGRRPAEAIPLLEDAVGRSDNAGDIELKLLLAEAYASAGRRPDAKRELEKLTANGKGNAKAFHARAEFELQEKNADKAAEFFSKALDADPRHASSALSLAAVELTLRRALAPGKKALASVDEKQRATLSLPEQAEWAALSGVALSLEGKADESLAALREAVKLDGRSSFAKGQLAQELARHRQHKEALPLLKEALALEADNLSLVEGLVEAHIAVGELAPAQSVLDAAGKRFPANARLAYLEGRVSESLRKFPDAEAHYKRAISGDAKMVEPQVHLAMLLVQNGRLAEAVPMVGEMLTQFPSDPSVFVTAGKVELVEGKVDLASEHFKKALSFDSRSAGAQWGLSRVAFEKGDLDTAEKAIRSALVAEPELHQGQLQLGYVLRKQGNLEAAAKAFTEARTQDPNNIDVYVALGQTQLALRQTSDALATLHAGIAIDPRPAAAYYELARALHAKPDLQEALAAVERAILRDEKNPEYFLEQGFIFRDSRKPSDAETAWKKGLAVNPQHADTLEALGTLALDGGLDDEAIGYFQKTMSSDPARVRLWEQIGDAHFHSNRWKDAANAFRKAINLKVQRGTLFFKLARCLTEQGQVKQAIEWYQRAASSEPTNPMPNYFLGYAYKEQGRRKEAIASFREYLSKKADAPDRREIEDEIYDLEQLGGGR